VQEYPPSLSPSRAADFTNCPLLFRFRSIDRLPEPPSAAAVRGTVVHRALETLFDLPAAERTPGGARELVGRALTELAADDPASAELVTAPDGTLVDLTPLIDGYFALEDPRRLEPHARELGVSVQIDPTLELRGVIDRVDKTPDGRVRIVDYKTGRAPGPGFERKALFQMRFYGLAWWRLTGVVPARLQLMYLASGETLSLDPDEDDLLSTEREVLALRSAIGRAADAGEFLPRRSRLCDWCSHRALCPEWGGTPPPLPPREDWPTTSSRPAPEDIDE
jgi:putative RecB family exonuclease